MQKKMDMSTNGSKQFSHVLLTLLTLSGLCLLVGLATGMFGCEAKPKDKCTSNLDCESTESCVKVGEIKDCKARGNLGDACIVGEDPCLPRDNDGKTLICDANDSKCKHRCETNLDCDSKDQLCNTDTGICEKGEQPDTPPVERTGPPGKKVGEECGQGSTCDTGLDCVTLGTASDGKCWNTCTEDKDCKDSRICASGHCVPNGDVCKGTPGGTLTTPCWAGLDCIFESAGEGKCFRQCTKDEECPNGLKCLDNSGKKYCIQGGDVAGPDQECGDVGGKQIGCTSGYQCAPERVNGSKKICTKECTSDAECNWPRFCSQLCTLGTVGTVKIGAVCEPGAGAAEDKRCDAGLDCLNLQTGGGLCYRSCKDPRADKCPDGTTCVEAGPEKYCLKTCTEAKDCAAPTPTCGTIQGTQGMHCIHGG